MSSATPALWVVVFSEAVALWLIWRLWRSEDPIAFKAVLSLVALLPVVGPVLVLWICNFPPRKPRILQDRVRNSSDFYDRWRHVLETRNPVRRFRYWQFLMTRHRNEDP